MSPTISRLFFIAVISFSFSQVTAEVTAFQISGTIKTQEKEKQEKREIPRGDTQLEVETKVLEIKLRRINPTVGGEVTVQWGIWMKDVGGKVKLSTQGKRELQTTVGQLIELTSDPIEIRSLDIDIGRRNRGNDREQEVEGYAIRIVDSEGNELGVKFQPSSLEEEARKVLESTSGKEDKDWSQGPGQRPGHLRPKFLRQ